MNLKSEDKILALKVSLKSEGKILALKVSLKSEGKSWVSKGVKENKESTESKEQDREFQGFGTATTGKMTR